MRNTKLRGFESAAATLVLSLIFLPLIEGFIDEDGLCSLFTFSPFTFLGLFSIHNLGFHHMAGALMAMDHFNARNTSVVQELSQFEDCNVRFDLNKSLFFDTGTLGHMASTQFFQAGYAPCAIAGPFYDTPALDLSSMAEAANVPLVASGGSNLRTVTKLFNSYSSQTFPTMKEATRVLLSFLRSKGRTDYISLLYSLSDTGVQRRETITYIFDDEGVQWKAYPYIGSLLLIDDVDEAVRDIPTALKSVKEGGFRTIIVALEDPISDFPILADTAEELGMNNGDYFWVWFMMVDLIPLFSGENATKLVAGSAWLAPIDSFYTLYFVTESDPFYSSWVSQGKDFVDKIKEVNPIIADGVGHIEPSDDYFRERFPEWGTGFIYDAVMSIGMGACLATQANGTIKGSDHVRGIRDVSFQGATGKIGFRSDSSDVSPGSRIEGTSHWAAFNFLKPQSDGEASSFAMSDARLAGTDRWESINPFVFADGRNVPPELLRDTPEQNYLKPALRAFGFALMGIAFFTVLLTVAWVYVHREHRVLKASQPHFLYVLALGSAVSASTIITISNDESFGWSDEQLDKACMATPWLLSLGHIITYGALFSKLWRVNKVLQFVRRKIQIRQVAWPSGLLVCAALLDLSLWTALDSLTWVRKEIDEESGEIIGRCESDNMWAYLGPLIALMIIPTVLTGIMAWKTKDVNEAYSESGWIFVLIILQLEVILFAVPMVVILRDLSTNGRYIGYVVMLWTLPMSTLLVIMMPKVIAYYKPMNGRTESHRRGNAHGSVIVSGLPGTTRDMNSSSKTSDGKVRQESPSVASPAPF